MEPEFVPALVMQTVLRDRRIVYAITDRNCTVLAVSDAGWSPHAHLTGGVGQNLVEVVPELVGSEATLADLLAGSLPRFQLPWVNREQPDGSLAYLTIILLPFHNKAGEITGLLLVLHDVTEMGTLERCITQQRNELRLLEEELRRQNAKLEAHNAELRRLDEMKSAFFSVAAHELRTPLAAIRGYLELLLDGEAGPLAGQQAEYLHIVDSSAQRLLHLSNQLLDSTRIETGRLDLVLQHTDLVELLHNVILELGPRFTAKAQRIVERAATGLPPCLCDVARAAQIMGNLLDNASKYSPPNSTITVTLRRADEDGFVQLAVQDEGIGIAADETADLFTPFYRAPGARQISASGVGLGLHIASSLVELHGGRLWFESVPGAGSTFYATFPIADPSSVV